MCKNAKITSNWARKQVDTADVVANIQGEYSVYTEDSRLCGKERILNLLT